MAAQWGTTQWMRKGGNQATKQRPKKKMLVDSSYLKTNDSVTCTNFCVRVTPFACTFTQFVKVCIPAIFYYTFTSLDISNIMF